MKKFLAYSSVGVGGTKAEECGRESGRVFVKGSLPGVPLATGLFPWIFRFPVYISFLSLSVYLYLSRHVYLSFSSHVYLYLSSLVYLYLSSHVYLYLSSIVYLYLSSLPIYRIYHSLVPSILSIFIFLVYPTIVSIILMYHLSYLFFWLIYL